MFFCKRHLQTVHDLCLICTTGVVASLNSRRSFTALCGTGQVRANHDGVGRSAASGRRRKESRKKEPKRPIALFVAMPGAPFVGSLLLVVRPGAPSSFLLLAMASNLVASSDDLIYY